MMQLYVAAICFLLFCFVVYTEYKDLNCPNGPMSDPSTCGCYKGLYLNGTEASKKDSNAEIIEKTNEASRGFSKLVIWRKAAILSTIAACMIYFLVPNMPSDPKIFFLCFIFTFFVSYFFSSFYDYHVYSKISHIVNSNLGILSSNLT
mgnify:CR=1 FL=1